jgi:hypothetical protein
VDLLPVPRYSWHHFTERGAFVKLCNKDGAKHLTIGDIFWLPTWIDYKVSFVSAPQPTAHNLYSELQLPVQYFRKKYLQNNLNIPWKYGGAD